MSTGHPEDSSTDTEEERDLIDPDEDVERTEEDERGFLTRGKDRYVDFHTVDEESDSWGSQQVFSNISRRGFIAGTAEAAVGVYALAEATDGDGWNIDWNSNGQAAGGGVAPPPGNETNGQDGQQGGLTTPEGLGEGSDRLYLQENGDVVAVDYADKELREFAVENFTSNEELTGLYDELESERGTEEIPNSYGSGVEVTPDEIFEENREAYDDMADEAEWDLIFDNNPGYTEGQ